MTNLGPPAPPTRVGEPVGFSRTTRDGRRLHYELKVLQQPERARACGSGPKSSADRRPVDPPPVVQMKVFQGTHRETAEDITFAYNADFFLYASLHHDPDLHHRPSPANAAVLTGLPVSSMILLDRPEEAGYFIFSDLSVRHEGRYILTFALMEEVKDDRDKDEDEAMAGTDEITGPDAGSGRHFQFRTQVQTDAFDVYSAKKFPGLQESTALSRTVAEQGCRVRIRRDVRMRRREKGGKGKEIAARDDEYASRAKADAANIVSRDGNDGGMRQYRPNDIQRRPSGMDPGYQHRPSYSTSVPSPGSRQPSYGHVAPYPSNGRSVPPPPAYPTPPHGAAYPPRALYAPYPNAERSPPEQHGPPAPPHPRDPRESYSYRGPDPVRPQPILAPKMEPEPEPKRATLPSIYSIGVQEPRRLLPHPPAKREAERLTLPPLAPSAYNFQQRPAQPPTPITPSLSRKRSADEANLAPADEYRLQNGRRRDEQPRDANYKMEPARLSHSYQVPMPVVQEERPGPPVDWSMSLDLYNRASDSDIPVDFPGLHQSRLGTSA